MANTYADYVGSDGTGTGNKEFPITFEYINTEHVAVEINEGPAGGANKWVRKTLTDDYTVETSPTKRVVLNTTPNSLWKIRVLRDSDATIAIVDFENGSVLTETELDNSYNHNRYLAEEAEEGKTGGALTKNETSGQFDADGLKLENLADPDSDDDAVNKGYADARYVDVAGDTMTGDLNMGSNDIVSTTSVQGLATPSSDNHAANKKYVDDQDALQVTKTGDTMSGALTLPNSDPTDANHATRKSYVDETITTSLATGSPPPGVQLGTAQIEDDAITADKLDNTTVTPGSYTNTDLTVDENGRITAASNGSSGAGATNLSNTPAASSVDIESSTGTNTTVAGATTSLAGVMTSSDKTKLDGIATGANNYTHPDHTGDVTSTGDGATVIADNAVTASKISATDSTFSIDGSGNMGLGIAANSAAKLYISGTGGNTFLAVKSDTMAAIDLEDSGAGTNEKHYQMVSLEGAFEIRQINDDLSLKQTPLTINSSGNVRIGGSLSNSSLESASQLGVTSSTAQTAFTVESTAASQNATAVLTAPGNATLQLNDTSESATDTGVYNVSSLGGEFQIGSIAVGGGGSNLTCMSLIRKTLSAVDYIVPQLPNIPTFADNSAATSGGLATNDVYKTSTGELRIVV